MAKEKGQILEEIRPLLGSENRFALEKILDEQRSSDIAEIVELLDNDQRRFVFDVLEKNVSAEVLEKVDEATRSELFELFGEKELTELISELDPDDAADVLSELGQEESEDVLDHMPEEDADQIKDLMAYSEDSAGGIMDPVLVSVKENATITEAIREIQSAEIDEDFFSVFVVSDNGKFVGDIRIRDLLTRKETTSIKDLTDTDTIYVHVDTDQEHVRNIFSKNDLIVMPVLDAKNRLVGRITADRVIEVAEEEAAEDMYVMAGTGAAELEKISAVHAAKVRMTWLLPCLAGTAVTAVVLLTFKNIFAAGSYPYIYTTIVAFAPMIAAISGNAGLQTSAIVVSGLATGDLAAISLRQVFAREVRVALFVAISCGIVGGILCGLLPNVMNGGNTNEITPALAEHLKIVAAFSTAMFSAIMVSTTLGLFLPFLFKRIGIDPAISSGPLITTANDSISVTIYMTLTLALIH
ncbi:MAG: magnesium transporter [Planctomycetes bacterium]|nr:magnesium transporter [Planctomycetota bacterium]